MREIFSPNAMLTDLLSPAVMVSHYSITNSIRRHTLLQALTPPLLKPPPKRHEKPHSLTAELQLMPVSVMGSQSEAGKCTETSSDVSAH